METITNNFSIIIPTYNGIKYIKSCIESLLNQTYTNYNILIVDSGSTDGTLEYLQNIKSDKIIIHTTDKRLYIEENWGRIVSLQKNEYITLLGQDDVLYPDYLLTMNDLIQKHPFASLYQTHFNFIDADGNITGKCHLMNETLSVYDFLKCYINRTLDSTATGYVMSSVNYNELGGIPTQYPDILFADYELWIRLIEKSYIAISDKTTFGYRVHQTNTSKISDAIKYQNAFLFFCDFLYILQKKNEDIKIVLTERGHTIFTFFCKSFSHKMLQIPKTVRNKTVIQYINECKQKAALLLGKRNKFHPYSDISILIAVLIDQFSFTLYLFSKYRKLKYGKK